MRFSIDSNILIYAAVEHVGPKHRAALDILRRAEGRDCVVTLQALGEAFRIMTAKYAVPATEAAKTVHDWRSVMDIVDADEACLVDAMDAVIGHQRSFWDAMMWATARRLGVRYLLTEDMQDGFTLDGVRFVNPFVSGNNELIDEILPTS